MDPITTTIITAIAGGAASGTTDVTKKAIMDAYNTIKEVIKSKFGAENKVSRAITELEDNPESKGQQMVLTEQVVKAKAHQDSDIVTAAEYLMEKIKQMPGGEQHIMNAQGKIIAQADRGSSASITINKGKPYG